MTTQCLQLDSTMHLQMTLTASTSKITSVIEDNIQENNTFTTTNDRTLGGHSATSQLAETMHAVPHNASYSTHLLPAMPVKHTKPDPDKENEISHRMELILFRLDKLDKALEGLVEIILAMPR